MSSLFLTELTRIIFHTWCPMVKNSYHGIKICMSTLQVCSSQCPPKLPTMSVNHGPFWRNELHKWENKKMEQSHNTCRNHWISCYIVHIEDNIVCIHFTHDFLGEHNKLNNKTARFFLNPWNTTAIYPWLNPWTLSQRSDAETMHCIIHNPMIPITDATRFSWITMRCWCSWVPAPPWREEIPWCIVPNML